MRFDQKVDAIQLSTSDRCMKTAGLDLYWNVIENMPDIFRLPRRMAHEPYREDIFERINNE